MLERIYYIIEVIACFYMLDIFFGGKINLSFNTVAGIVFELVIVELINDGLLPEQMIVGTYAIMLIYLFVEYRKKWYVNLTGFIGVMAFIAVLQMAASLAIYGFFGELDENVVACAVNGFLLFVAVLLDFTNTKERLHRFTRYLKLDGMATVAALGGLAVLTGVAGIKIYHSAEVIDLLELIVIFVAFIFFFLVLVKEHEKYLLEKQEKNLDRIYGNAFVNMIDDIRRKQHNFDNQINTITNIYYMASSVEEIKNRLEEYQKHIKRENKYNRMLSSESCPVLLGFLYSKFNGIDNSIEVEPHIAIGSGESRLGKYKLIELLGILIDNAAESQRDIDEKDRKIRVELIESKEILNVSIANISPVIPIEEIAKFFQQGYSTKGPGRGLGLYEVKSMVEKSRGQITAENLVLDNSNWFRIKIEIPK